MQVVHQVSRRAIMFVGVKDDALVPMEETLDLFAHARELKRLVMMPASATTVAAMRAASTWYSTPRA